jgi:elongation factor Ts
MDKAIGILRSRFAKAAVKRGMNETAEGRVAIAIDPAKEVAAIVEMRSESAPVTKSEQFVALGNAVAKQVAAGNPKAVEDLLTQQVAGGSGTVTDAINEVIGLLRENMKIQRFVRLTGGHFGEYVHHDGTLGVLVQVKGASANPDLLRDVCAHIAAYNPQYATTAEVPADVAAKEKEIAMSQIAADPKNAGKPANIIEMITAGKMKTWFAETVLLEQGMANSAKYPNQSVGQLLKAAGLELVKFVRFKVGEVAV